MELLQCAGVRGDEVQRLVRAGFGSAAELLQCAPRDLAQQTGLSRSRVDAVLAAANGAPRTPAQHRRQQARVSTSSLMVPNADFFESSLAAKMQSENTRRGIVCCCRGIDELFEDGFPMGRIVELCGEPGIGKTQICMQLACTVQIPPEFGGNAGDAVYIDSEGSLMPQRLHEIAAALVSNMQNSARVARNPARIDAARKLSADQMLDRIHVFRVHSHEEQVATVDTLHAFVHEHPKVRLVILDSVAFHFRHSFRDMAQRTRILAGLASKLRILATDFGVAVVVTNQMTYQPSNLSKGTSSLVPALGPTWAHQCNQRLLLRWRANSRVAHLIKSPWSSEGSAEFCIGARGVQGPPS